MRTWFTCDAERIQLRTQLESISLPKYSTLSYDIFRKAQGILLGASKICKEFE